MILHAISKYLNENGVKNELETYEETLRIKSLEPKDQEGEIEWFSIIVQNNIIDFRYLLTTAIIIEQIDLNHPEALQKLLDHCLKARQNIKNQTPEDKEIHRQLIAGNQYVRITNKS